MERETSRKNLLNFSHSLSRKLEANPASFQGVCMIDISIVEDLAPVNIFLYDIDFDDGEIIGELVKRNVGEQSNTIRLIRYNSHIFLSLVSRYSSKLIAAHRVRLFPTERQIWNVIQPLAVKKLNMCTRRTCISSMKHCLTNLIRLVSLIQTTKNSLTSWPFLTFNQSVWNMKISRMPKQLHGFGYTFQFRNQNCPT